MIEKERILQWCAIEHDLYEENNNIFGIELDLFNNHVYHYHKSIYGDGEKCYTLLDGDIYNAIDEFNEILKHDI